MSELAVADHHSAASDEHSQITPLTTEDQTKRKRASKACDACRARKIKCRFETEDAVKCTNCTVAEIPCKQEQPRKRRGPTSRYVEAQRQALLDQGNSEQALLSTPGNWPSHLASAITRRPTTEDLAPRSVIDQVLDEWFEFVHPVAPILHRDSFLQTWNNVDDQTWDFQALVISICAATVAALRRRAAVYESLVTVERCMALLASIEDIKGALPVSLIRAQIKYNMAVVMVQERGLDSAESQLIMVETIGMVSYLLHYQAESMSFRDRELCKRLYWLCFAGECTAGLHSRPYVMPSAVLSSLESAALAELNDSELHYIEPDRRSWHGNTTSYIPGLKALIDVFIVWYKCQQGDCSNLDHLRHCMEQALSSLDNLPPALRWRGGLSRPAKSNFGTDVQMVNLYITQIHVRSFLMDQMSQVATRNNDHATIAEIAKSRQTLIDDMLAIVYQMPEATLEANGFSLIGKVRDIGLSLLDDNVDPTLAYANLDRLLAKLDKLDIRRNNTGDSTSPLSMFTSPRSIP